MNFSESYSGKRVLVTGHTGFKGSWLCEWLLKMKAEVHGLALEPATQPALFDQLGLAKRIQSHTICDIRNRDSLEHAVEKIQPQIIFHLAAQALVRESYMEPVETYLTNVMGTIHLLESLKKIAVPCVAVFVTTDKCYLNKEWDYGYRETDPLGGFDPYSSSKACCELAIAAFRDSFFHPAKQRKILIASARAGNVIGGGDWAKDRIVPDCIRALARNESISVRNPHATRPWQHVLEPLSGYLSLARLMFTGQTAGTDDWECLCAAFNFGPALSSNRNVRALVNEVLKHWEGEWKDCSTDVALHEASKLNLATDKAYHVLGWTPKWGFEDTIAKTVAWYKGVAASEGVARDITRQQIISYSTAGGES